MTAARIQQCIQKDVARARVYFRLAMRAKRKGNMDAAFNYVRAVKIAMRTARSRKATLKGLA